MKQKIIFGSIFATLIILTQAVIMPTVFADEDETEIIILTDEQRATLENAISILEGTELYDDIKSIYESSINDKNELRIDTIHEMLQTISHHYEKKSLLNSEMATSLRDILITLIQLTIEFILLIPVAMVVFIVEDIYEILDYYAQALENPEFALSVSISIFLPNFYELLVSFELLKDVTVDKPDMPDDTKVYLKQFFFEAVCYNLRGLLGFTVTLITQGYLYPKFGYLSRIGVDLVGMCKSVQELVKDAKVKLEHFKEIFIDVPIAFIDLVDPRDGEIITDFTILVKQLKDAKQHAKAWYNESLDDDPGILFDIGGIIATLGDLVLYFNIIEDKPWLRPIEVKVQVIDLEEDDVAYVSFKDPSQNDTTEITYGDHNNQRSIFYVTNTTENPCGMHTFVLVIEKNGKVIERTGKAFSDGAICIDVKFKKARSDTENILNIFKERLINLFECLSIFIKSIFSLNELDIF